MREFFHFCWSQQENRLSLIHIFPHEMKYQQGIKKKILKDIAYDYLPKELLERPKTGFAVPMDQWLHGPRCV